VSLALAYKDGKLAAPKRHLLTQMLAAESMNENMDLVPKVSFPSLLYSRQSASDGVVDVDPRTDMRQLANLPFLGSPKKRKKKRPQTGGRRRERPNRYHGHDNAPSDFDREERERAREQEVKRRPSSINNPYHEAPFLLPAVPEFRRKQIPPASMPQPPPEAPAPKLKRPSSKRRVDKRVEKGYELNEHWCDHANKVPLGHIKARKVMATAAEIAARANLSAQCRYLLAAGEVYRLVAATQAARAAEFARTQAERAQEFAEQIRMHAEYLERLKFMREHAVEEAALEEEMLRERAEKKRAANAAGVAHEMARLAGLAAAGSAARALGRARELLEKVLALPTTLEEEREARSLQREEEARQASMLNEEEKRRRKEARGRRRVNKEAVAVAFEAAAAAGKAARAANDIRHRAEYDRDHAEEAWLKKTECVEGEGVLAVPTDYRSNKSTTVEARWFDGLNDDHPKRKAAAKAATKAAWIAAAAVISAVERVLQLRPGGTAGCNLGSSQRVTTDATIGIDRRARELACPLLLPEAEFASLEQTLNDLTGLRAEQGEVKSKARRQTVYPTQAEQEELLGQLPVKKNWRHRSQDWGRFSDELTGFEYWYHKRTGETLWCDD
jgi:hypothetical protein